MLALLALALAADPHSADLLMLDLKPVSVAPEEARVVNGLVAEAIGDALERAKLRMATSEDLRTLATLDAERAAAGCDVMSCMAEIAGALGARYVVTGTLGALGGDRILQLSLFDVRVSQSLERVSVQASTPQALAPEVRPLVARLLAPLAGADRDGDGGPKSSRARPPRAARGISGLAVAGIATAGAGVVLGVTAGAGAVVLDARLAARSNATPAEKQDALAWGPAVVVAAIVGGAVAVAGLGLAGYGFAQAPEPTGATSASTPAATSSPAAASSPPSTPAASGSPSSSATTDGAHP